MTKQRARKYFALKLMGKIYRGVLGNSLMAMQAIAPKQPNNAILGGKQDNEVDSEPTITSTWVMNIKCAAIDLTRILPPHEFRIYVLDEE